jgi:hypothetical protein
VFDFFKAKEFVDAEYGKFSRSGGYWRSTIRLGGSDNIPLALAGNRVAPASAALAELRWLVPAFAGLEKTVAQALYEHYEPYCDALAAGELQLAESLPLLHTAAQALSFSSLSHVLIEPLGGQWTTELAYETRWDEEHTLGARFRNGQWLELCGSTLRP